MFLAVCVRLTPVDAYRFLGDVPQLEAAGSDGFLLYGSMICKHTARSSRYPCNVARWSVPFFMIA